MTTNYQVFNSLDTIALIANFIKNDLGNVFPYLIIDCSKHSIVLPIGEDIKDFTNFTPIINNRSNIKSDKNDYKRLAGPITSTNKHLFQGLSTFVSDIFNDKSLKDGNYTITINPLLSLEGCKLQPYHQDWDTISENLPTTNYSYNGIFSASVNSTVNIKVGSKYYIVPIPLNHLFIARQDLIHAGSAYDKENLRIHFYFDAADCKREKDIVWLVTLTGMTKSLYPHSLINLVVARSSRITNSRTKRISRIFKSKSLKVKSIKV
jgi:hypothetical protein